MPTNELAPPTNGPRHVVRRVAWVTPDFPPDRGGVSDHSSAMATVLRAAGYDVLVCSRPHERGFDVLDDELSEFAPDLLIVAYVPLGYAPRTGGLAPAFAKWSIGLRKRLGCPAILLAHEASLPVVYHWHKNELKLVALAIAQMAQFSVVAACFDTVLFSNLLTQRAWAKNLSYLSARFHTIRICSNIPLRLSANPGAELSAQGAFVPSPTILFFGTGHESVLLDYVEKAFLAMLAVEPEAGLVIVGMTPEKLAFHRPSLANFGARVRALGYVEAPLVSLWLQVATLVLAPLIEGVGARKGTVMAALQHGRAVVTTRGPHTCDDIEWDRICILTPLDAEAYATSALEALRAPERRAKVGQAAREEYEAHASPSITALEILSYAY